MKEISGCQPEMPVTSSIIIDLDGFSVPVNKNLYGVTIEEINHAIDGGVYAEMIQNRSFEDGSIAASIMLIFNTLKGIFISLFINSIYRLSFALQT